MQVFEYYIINYYKQSRLHFKIIIFSNICILVLPPLLWSLLMKYSLILLTKTSHSPTQESNPRNPVCQFNVIGMQYLLVTEFGIITKPFHLIVQVRGREFMEKFLTCDPQSRVRHTLRFEIVMLVEPSFITNCML